MKKKHELVGGLCVTPGHQTDKNGDCIIPSAVPIEGAIQIPTNSAIKKKIGGICTNKTFFNLVEYRITDYSKNSLLNINGINVYQYITLENINNPALSYTFTTHTTSIINSGTYGSVFWYRCTTYSTDDPAYISVKYSINPDGVKRDIEVIDLLKNKGVTELYVPSLYIKESSPYPDAVIMEYIDGTLSNIPIDTLVENNFIVLFGILLQIAKTLDAFKKYNLWYMDYKPANIFFRCDNNKTFQVIFGDLGSLCETGKFCPATYPPLSNNEYGPFNDSYLVWGVAVTMYVLLSSKLSVTNKHMYGWEEVKKYRDGSKVYKNDHNDNINALQKVLVVNTSNVTTTIVINQLINKFIIDIFATFDVNQTISVGGKLITLEKVILTLEVIIFLLSE